MNNDSFLKEHSIYEAAMKRTVGRDAGDLGQHRDDKIYVPLHISALPKTAWELRRNLVIALAGPGLLLTVCFSYYLVLSSDP